MAKLQTETAQNVIIEQKVANIGERIGAFFIDGIIIFAYYIFLFLIISAISAKVNNDLVGFIFLVFLLPVFFYSLLCETFMNGQSFGKKAVKIKVTKIDGSQPTFGNYLIRWLFRIIDISFYGLPAIITIAVNGRGQRIGDIVAKTSVISLKNSKKIDETIYSQTDENYIPVYSEAEFLNDSDVNTINEVLQHYKKSPGNAIAISMIKQTFEAVKKKTGAQPKDVPAIFLETIIKDYNYIHKTKKLQ